MIYFDQAASSFPKPPEVTEAMLYVLSNNGANPGRGAHRLARQASEIVNGAREKISKWCGCENPRHVLFFNNATTALNQAIKGQKWNAGDHVITTSFEHNSVRRPLEYISKTYGVDVSYIDAFNDVQALVERVELAITKETKYIIMTHASNVTGDVLPLEELTKLAKKHQITTIVDGSQTAGHFNYDMTTQSIDMLAFPGHKGVLGPQGTGVLAVNKVSDMIPLHHGGTGFMSETIDQPEQWPEKYESGTLNTPGIAGLSAAIDVLNNQQKEKDIVSRETILINKLINGLEMIKNINIYGPPVSDQRLPIVSFNIKNISSQEIGMVLDSHYEIMVRSGLHCSPLTHETIGTINQGAVRVSLNRFNTKEEVEIFLSAINEITQAYDGI